MAEPALTAEFARPYVVSWNLTYRCNLACEHCYLDAGGSPLVESEAFSDRSELDTEQCKKVVDDIAILSSSWRYRFLDIQIDISVYIRTNCHRICRSGR